MNINRDNYELFFLLYVDNELSAAERGEVEAFIATHPDLAIELSQLQDATLPSESFQFHDKSSLYKSSQDEINQETLLMHLDGELTMPAAAAAEVLISSKDELQKEWALLQQCKLDKSEVVVFPGKAMLYRKERDKVVVMRFVRIAVAAMLVGAGLFFAFNLVSTNTGTVEPTEIATTGTPKTGTGQPSPVLNPSENRSAIESSENGSQQLASVSNSKHVQNRQEKRDRQTKVSEASRLTVSNSKQAASDPGEQTLLASNKDPKQFERPSPERTNEEMELAQLNKVSKPNITDVNVTPIDNSMARTAGLTNLETVNEDKILYMEEDKITRTKAAGFLRKIKRTVERNTRIKTGNGLRIAGFEIAAK